VRGERQHGDYNILFEYNSRHRHSYIITKNRSGKYENDTHHSDDVILSPIHYIGVLRLSYILETPSLDVGWCQQEIVKKLSRL